MSTAYTLENVTKIQAITSSENIITLSPNFIIDPDGSYSKVTTAMTRLLRLSDDTLDTVQLTEVKKLDELDKYICTNIDEGIPIKPSADDKPRHYNGTLNFSTLQGVLSCIPSTQYNGEVFVPLPLRFDWTNNTAKIQIIILRSYTPSSPQLTIQYTMYTMYGTKTFMFKFLTS